MRAKIELSLIIVVASISVFLGAILGSQIEFTQGAMYQTMTAVIECLAVLLGLFGVFAAFRLEIQERDLRDAKDALRIMYDTSLKSPEEVYEKVKEMMKEERMPSGLTHEGVKVVHESVDRLHVAIERKKNTKELTRFPLVCMTILLILSLCILPLIGLSEKASPIVTAFVLAVIGLSIYTVYRTVDSLDKFIFG